MEEAIEELRVIPELYFLIAKFLSGGPLKETAKTLLKELDTIEVLPRRLDWEGNEHAQSYDELASQYSEVSWRRLASVCERALHLARGAPTSPGEAGAAPSEADRLAARLSLLSETLVRPKPKYASHKQDHALVRRIMRRELGVGSAYIPGGRGGEALFPPRLLGGLQLQRRTLGHLSAVYCLVVDCSGRVVVTGADDMLVKVWSACDGRLLSTLRGVGAEVTDVCVSADGWLVACGSVDRLVRVWRLDTGEPRAVLPAHQGTITSVHWAPPARRDVRWLASTSTDCSVAFWTCSADGQFLSQPVQYVERMRPGVCHMICAAWSAGGAFLAAGSADHHVRVYTVEHEPGGPKRVLETPVHDDAVDSIAWAHRGLRFVSGSKDGSAALWTLHATQWRHVLLQPKSTQQDGKRLKMTMVCWDRSDAFVLTAASDCTVRVWCARSAAAVRTLCGHSDEAYVLEAHPFLPAVFLSAGHDGQLFVWDANHDQPLAMFHNRIEGHGDGAIFDAKWSGGSSVAATDSHGHLLFLGLGRGHRLFAQLPTELFFHTDYRPVVVDALGGAHDEQTDTPPHLLPPPFLVDVEGAPHPPQYQRLVPGRENLALAQLIPAASPRALVEGGVRGGVWRGEGVRHTAGSWQTGAPLPPPRRAHTPRSPAAAERAHLTAADLNALEQAWYRREMRRRPVMISTVGEGGRRPRARPRPRAPRAPRPARPERPEPPEPESASGADSEDEWVGRRHTASSNDSHHSSLDLSDTDTSSHSGSKSDSSSSSSQYSDWEAGAAALAPPARARRRPLPTNRYSPSTVTTKRATTERPTTSVDPGGVDTGPALDTGPAPSPAVEEPPPPAEELPDVYRPGEWITAVSPRKAPYHPQMGDQCLYFRLGHQRYFEAVAEKDVYKVNPRDKPWERTHVYECELAKVVGIKYVIMPPRVACVRLACVLGGGRRVLTVRYHDMPDVIDFIVLRHHYDAASARDWRPGDRFRCIIDDCWWTGTVLESSGAAGGSTAECGGLAGEGAAAWAAAAAQRFLSLRVRWDNGELERLSPWDLEPLDPDRLPSEPGGAVAVLPHELQAVLPRAEAAEWAPACRAIANHVGTVMSLSAAEPFLAPVDLSRYPLYAKVVPYPVDLATMRARFHQMFYRRAAAAQFDARYLATNAERFNKAHSPIVRAARTISDLLLYIIGHWRDVDVLAKYHELVSTYRSDDEPARPLASRKMSHGEEWRDNCSTVLTELMASADAEPFRQRVSPEQAPDYTRVVSHPMDLGTIRAKLAAGEYSRAEQFAADVRLVFANSRLYNTNKRSRIYSMTVRLSALFEALWSRHSSTRAGRALRPSRSARNKRTTRRTRGNNQNGEVMNGCTIPAAIPTSPLLSSGSSSSEPLCSTSRRIHARDSWDSDAPLRVHTKGKGVGKKSKSSSASAEPVPSTSRAAPDECYVAVNGSAEAAASSWEGSDNERERGSSGHSHIQVLEEEINDEVEITYDSEHRREHSVRSVRKRRLPSSDSSVDVPLTAMTSSSRHRHTPNKRIRERFTEASTSSSSCSSESSHESGGRYESDHSYRPRYSSDDDAPLHLYRTRPDPAPTRPRARRGVSLRTRRGQRYNEDSEEDSVAAISKRLQHHHHSRSHHAHVARRRRHHALQGAQAAGSGRTTSHTAADDHDYVNGHAHSDVHANGGPSSGVPAESAVSISSRGRVRKLTAKARGLLRD